jgi:hypothetical protein
MTNPPQYRLPTISSSVIRIQLILFKEENKTFAIGHVFSKTTAMNGPSGRSKALPAAGPTTLSNSRIRHPLCERHGNETL